MLRVYVPIRENDVERSLRISRNTSSYLINQARENLTYLFNEQRDVLVKFLDFISGCKDKRIHFAARGRSLLLGARTFADRLTQLNLNAVYPTLEQYVVYDPNAVLGKGEIVICFSTSGRTGKVLKKARFGREIGCEIIVITGSLNSPLVELASFPVIHLKYDYKREELLSKYKEDEMPFTPLGTTSEYTQLIFSEAICRGLMECILKNENVDKSFKISKETAFELLDRAESNLNAAYSDEDEIAALLANFLLKYYSEQTVHFCARGKTFNMAVGPFKMRLDQIPHAFVTSIIDFEPLNRPVRKGQITFTVSGSGAAYSIARMAKEMGSMIIGITSFENALWEISDIKIKVPGRKDHDNIYDWDIRQWKGWRSPFAPEGTEFEVSVAAFLDGIFAGLATYIGIREEDMRLGHANIE